jgi:rSAM/selenodomain-associated transferase 1
MKNENALIIIAKHPQKAEVKTRLSRSLSDKKRIKLYTYLVEDTMKRLGRIESIDTFIACAPMDSSKYFSRFGLSLLPLPEGDLGERMFYAFGEIFKRGYRRSALVGVDIPALTGKIVAEAFNLLSENDVVFGPAQDGGYYLIGMTKLMRELFEGVPWSSNETLGKSVENAKRSRCRVAFTRPLSDIDTIEDVRKAGFQM